LLCLSWLAITILTGNFISNQISALISIIPIGIIVFLASFRIVIVNKNILTKLVMIVLMVGATVGILYAGKAVIPYWEDQYAWNHNEFKTAKGVISFLDFTSGSKGNARILSTVMIDYEEYDVIYLGISPIKYNKIFKDKKVRISYLPHSKKAVLMEVIK